MPRILFGEWLPDLPPTGLDGVTVATNVIPDAASYRPFPSLTFLGTAALASRALGAIIATDPANVYYNYFGDASALYSLVANSFSNVSRLVGGGYTTVDNWEFANWGNTIIGVNGFIDLPQQTSLGAANFANMSIGVKAKHIAVMRDFVVLGNVSDSATNAYRVRWSAINNPLDFTVSPSTLSDYQDLPSEGGPVQRMFGGEYGVVLQRRSIWRMQFVGSPVVFQFDRVHSTIGAYAPMACARFQNLVFFLAEDGFYVFNGSALTPIGRGKVDKFFLDDLDANYSSRIVATVDTINKLVMWAYPGSGNNGGNPNKIMVYSWAFQRWSLVEGLNVQFVYLSIVSGYTLDTLDLVNTSLDALPFSLDSAEWTGGQLILAAFNSSNQLQRFNGSAMASTMETGEFQLFEGQLSMLTEIRPDTIGMGSSATISVLNRNNLNQSVSVGAASISPNVTGFAECRVTARYFRIRHSTAAGSDFTHLVGVEVAGTPAGVR